MNQTPDFNNLNACLLESFDKYANESAIEFLENNVWQKVTFRQVKSRALSVLKALLTFQLVAGDRVAIWSNSRAEWIYSDLAVLLGGGVTAAIPKNISKTELKDLLLDLQPKFLFLETKDQLGVLESLMSDIESLEKVFLFEDHDQPDERFVHFSWIDKIASHTPLGETLEVQSGSLGLEDIVTIVYGSGDDKRGKCLSHGNFLNAISGNSSFFNTAELSDVRKNFNCQSFGNPFERFFGYFWMLAKGKTIVFGKFSELRLSEIATAQPDFISGTPEMFEKLFREIQAEMQGGSWISKNLFAKATKIGEETIEQKVNNETPKGMLGMKLGFADKMVFSKIKKKFGGKLNVCFSSGGILSQEVEQFFFTIGIPMYNVYTNDAFAGPISLNTSGEVKLGSYGKPIENVQVRLTSDKKIAVKSSTCFLKYWNGGNASLEDGFLDTGEIGFIDRDGFLFVGPNTNS